MPSKSLSISLTASLTSASSAAPERVACFPVPVTAGAVAFGPATTGTPGSTIPLQAFVGAGCWPFWFATSTGPWMFAGAIGGGRSDGVSFDQGIEQEESAAVAAIPMARIFFIRFDGLFLISFRPEYSRFHNKVQKLLTFDLTAHTLPPEQPPEFMKNLVIVESPAKGKTIEKYLGKDFMVKASMGHIRDLEKKNLGIDIAGGFKPSYVVSEEKKKTVTELKKLVKDADKVWIATDEDRE